MAQRGHHRKIMLYMPHLLTAIQVLSKTDLIATLPERLVKSFSKKLNLVWQPAPIEIPAVAIKQIWHQFSDSDIKQIWLRKLIATVAAKQK